MLGPVLFLYENITLWPASTQLLFIGKKTPFVDNKLLHVSASIQKP